VSRLLLMLSSSYDGEVVNAARAIQGALKRADCDLHDLANALNHQPQDRNLATSRGSASKPMWKDLVNELAAHKDCGCLTTWEIQFAETLAGYRNRPTDKQMACIERILKRIEEKHAQAA
jgi:hypothetical protein